MKFKAFATSIALIPPMAALHGYLLSIMWGWFAVPIGAPAIGVCHAYGLAVVVRLAMATARKTDSSEHTVPALLDGALFQLVYALLVFATAAVAYSLM